MSYKLADQFVDRVIAMRPELLRHAALLIGKRTDIGSPEDFVQDTLVTALQNADRFEDYGLSGWLIAILHNHIRNARRRQRRNPTSRSLTETASSDEAEMIEFPVAATQELTLEVEDVMVALRTLSVADQEIIRLARIEGLPLEEIAERLGVQLGTVYSRLSRATTKLRAAYDATPDAATMRASVPNRRAA
ncbi:RNA polymerase sigma-70 factor (ECF subfamily) [Rhodopseudomonas rhenobacensis]|uniref:RNA polymerase sigma-70 factor (ECF subfamily) n=1 Tax=Rhodopseudomonas rhenobacensis TaxID=87461 RepID=A0A7W7Z112_9BRAD|nr:RNA polymerase sigma factor [Rhodopseudomonas rhenobacensis]MBB5045946.1 RNA polymerase sigma-70 factor (ECF subfamily) [Rhodopseudomonas rhenobacensis]